MIYYIDLNAPVSGLGTEQSPFNALTDLPTLVGSDVVRLKRGSYKQISKYTVNASGAIGNFITFEDYGDPNLPKPKLIPIQGQGTIDCVGRNYILFRNISIVGEESWTSQSTYGILFNGGGTVNYVDSCSIEYCGIGINLSGGFAKTNVRIINTDIQNCTSDGIRFFSASANYFWQDIVIRNCKIKNNGRAQGSNGCGINFYILPGHVDAGIRDVVVEGCEITNNYRAGIIMNDDGVAYTSISAANNTVAPVRRIRGLDIRNNKIHFNGGAGISVLGAMPSDKMPARICKNELDGNGIRTTLGNIWTGCSLRLLIEKNKCYRAVTNGTTVGDGIGIFDDQWNDSCTVRWNLVKDNIFNPLVNPDYSSYGIGIYRCTNSKHYGNVIQGCRYGYVIGNVVGATQPVMQNIVVSNTTIQDTEKVAIAIWSEVPANSITLRDVYIDKCDQPLKADSANAGNQTFVSVRSSRNTNNTDGANINNGCSFDGNDSLISELTPFKDSVLFNSSLVKCRDYNGNLVKIVGAVGYPTKQVKE